MSEHTTPTPCEPQWHNPLRDPRDLRLPRIAGPCSIVIFGVTGDLSNRGLLPPSFGLTGFARRDWTEDHFRDFVKENVKEHCRTHFHESTWKQLAEGIRFVQGTFEDADAFERLSNTVAELDRDRGTRGNHAFYMSVPPRDFPIVAKQLANCGLAKSEGDAWRRVIIEKPFGHDLASAKKLDAVISEVFDPDSVFRIDHYLGKETVQNLLALRFANTMYEPIWNANYVDHVQITMAEDIGVAGRAGYYDGIGAARDVIQNHLLQLMALTAMEEPVSFSARDLTDEKTKVLSAVRLPKDLAAHTARGQYSAGWQGSEPVVGYLEEKGISRAVLDNLCAKGVLECSKVNKSIDLYSSIPLKNEPILLTEEQQAAYDALLPGLEDAAPHSALLYGVTGSGKTLVFLKLIEHCLQLGRRALVLVPEISLTPQMILRLKSQFGR